MLHPEGNCKLMIISAACITCDELANTTWLISSRCQPLAGVESREAGLSPGMHLLAALNLRQRPMTLQHQHMIKMESL